MHVGVADQIHDARALDVIVFHDEEVLDTPLDECADAREGGLERLGRHRFRQMRERALAERALPLVDNRDDVHRNVARGRIVLEEIEDPPSVRLVRLDVERDRVRAIPVRQRHGRIGA